MTVNPCSPNPSSPPEDSLFTNLTTDEQSVISGGDALIVVLDSEGNVIAANQRPEVVELWKWLMQNPGAFTYGFGFGFPQFGSPI